MGQEAKVDLVVLEHNYVTNSRLMGEKGAYCATLVEPVGHIYTPGEWVVFYLGARAGEYDFGDTDSLYLRDSKNPEGNLFVFSFEEGSAFIEALKGGKYDLPFAQEQEVIAYLVQQRVEAGGDLRPFADYIQGRGDLS